MPSFFKTASQTAGVLIAAALTACFALAGPAARAQNLVKNGGFETGDFTGWNVNGTGMYQFSSVEAGVGVGGSYAASFGAFAPYIDTLSQPLAVVGGQQYSLTFCAQTPRLGLHGIPGYPTGQPNFLLSTFGGNSLGLATVPDSGGFEQYSYTFTAAASPTPFVGLTTLTFYVSNYYDFTQIDNISVVPVPEASTTVSFAVLLTLGCIVVTARKKKASIAASANG